MVFVEKKLILDECKQTIVILNVILHNGVL